MVRNALSRKLIRDIWKNRMQFLAVILLCALGTWLFSGLDAAWRMIDLSANTYFEEQNLADLWVTLQPVDRQTLKTIELTDGVERLQARATVNMDTDLDNDSSLMVTAIDRPSEINIPLMYEGEPLADNDLRGCLLDDAFAKANNLHPGDSIGLKWQGQTWRYVIRGTCLSPEYVALSKNLLKDSSTYGFVIVNHDSIPMLPLSSVVVELSEGADEEAVKASISEAYPEALIIDHASHTATHGVQKDVDMFRNLSYLFPLLAYFIAALIVLTTITRMLENQRVQMGTLKALGYRDGQMLRHYLSYALYPSLIGSVLGLVVGRLTLPDLLWVLEEVQFTLPYRIQAPVSPGQIGACVLCVVLAVGICYKTYRSNAKEQTASLLRPKPPKAGKRLLLERWTALWNRLGFNGKMVVRNLLRNKVRTLMSFMGVFMCTALLITSLGLQDSVQFFVDKYYRGTVQYTVRAGLTGSAGEADAYRKRVDAERTEAVMDMTVSARSGTDSRTIVMSIMEDDQQLMNFGPGETWMPMPVDGVMVTQKMAEVLHIGVGDPIQLWLTGDDEPIHTYVESIASVTVGQNVYMSQSLWEKQNKGGFVPTALHVKNPTEAGLRYLKDLDELDELLYPTEQGQDTLKILDSLSQIFGLMSAAALGLAFVVLYNMGLLNFMERSREYATLKVLGYHQKEIRRLITTENNLLTGLGILCALWPGRFLTGLVLKLAESDTMVFASTVKLPSYAIACVVTYLFSWLITKLLTRKVKTIDMVEALKSVE